jgi:hypothetical protein
MIQDKKVNIYFEKRLEIQYKIFGQSPQSFSSE